MKRRYLLKKVMVVCLVGATLMLGACGEKKTEKRESVIEETGPTIAELDEALSNCKYSYGQLSIKVGVLVNNCVLDYEIEYCPVREGVEKGYVSSYYITDNEYRDTTYAVCISGGVTPNLDLRSYTIDTPKALTAVLIYDDSGNLVQTSVEYVNDMLRAAALQLMTY